VLAAGGWFVSPAAAGWHSDASLARKGLRLEVAKGRLEPTEANA
jgi:hypothetical protein